MRLEDSIRTGRFDGVKGAPLREQHHWVYVIAFEDDPAVKIGIGLNLDKRLGNYRTHYWKAPVVLAACLVETWDAARQLESALLFACRADSIRGEWVRRTDNVGRLVGSISALRLMAEANGIQTFGFGGASE